MDRYTELYAWIFHSFGEAAFSIDEFRATFPTSQAPKVIHDLVGQGYLERVKRGVYRAVRPGRLIESVVRAGRGDVLEEAERKYAYCGSNAVAIWTDGYYWTGFTRGFNPRHIKVRERDLDYWEEFFRKHARTYAVEGESRTLYGLVYILHPEEDFAVEERDGYKVIPLEEVVSYCLENELSYSPALEYLDEHYDIGYRRREALTT
ncbi:MAG: hypothetical protein ACE5LQ_01840 [Candidatus Bipolaricaulia bacterium]